MIAARKLSHGWQRSIIVFFVLAFAAGVFLLSKADRRTLPDLNSELSSQARRPAGIFHPTAAQWTTLTVEPVEQQQFRMEFATEGKIAVNEDSSTPIFSPYAGRVTTLRAKPGEFVKRGQLLFVVEATDTVHSGATDPAFVIGDLSTVWLTAFVRETDASNVGVGQDIVFSVLAAPGRNYHARINYLASAFDPATRRLLVRATVDNKDGVLKPEMFANVTLYSSGDLSKVDMLGVPRNAVIYEGDVSRVWVARDDQSIELRQVKLGLTNGKMVQVLAGVRLGEKVITKGSLFIDRAATSS